MITPEQYGWIDGLTPITDETAALLAMGEQFRGVYTDTIVPRADEEELLQAIETFVAPLARDITYWEFDSGTVGLERALRSGTWHCVEDNFFTASNTLTTQVLVVPSGGVLSSRGEDVVDHLKARFSGTAPHPETLSDDELVANEVSIISLLPNVLYHCWGNPWHRPAVNHTDHPIERTFLQLAEGQYILKAPPWTPDR